MKYAVTMLTATILVALLASAVSADYYRVTIENLIPGLADTGNPFTPPVAVVHSSGYQMFTPGSDASPAVEELARDGATAALVTEANASPDVYDVQVGAMMPFFDSVEFVIEATPGDLFSVVTMLARSNDLITGLYDEELLASGTVYYEPPVWDAGVEVNTGAFADIPFYGNTFVGPDEDDVIATIDCYSVQDDPDYGVIEYCFPPNARISIKYSGMSPVEDETWGRLKALYR